MNCPICNTTIDDIKGTLFCPKCHWELAAIPTNAILLKKDYEDRLIVFSHSYGEIDPIETLSQKIQGVKRQNDSLVGQISMLKEQTEEKFKELEQLKDELRSLQDGPDKLRKKQKTLEDAEKKIDEYKKKQPDLLEIMDKVKRLNTAYQLAFRHGYGYRLGAVKKFLDDYKMVFSEYSYDEKD